VLAVIPRQIESSNARVEPRELSDLLPAVVGASVVDEDELILEPPRAERLRDPFRKQSERRTAVVDGDDDRDFRGQRSAPVSFRSRTDGLYAVLDERILCAVAVHAGAARPLVVVATSRRRVGQVKARMRADVAPHAATETRIGASDSSTRSGSSPRSRRCTRSR
jgi:hypothetical protein